jgi:hypothetical protein
VAGSRTRGWNLTAGSLLIVVGGLSALTGARLTEGPRRPPIGRSCEPGVVSKDVMSADPIGGPSRPWPVGMPGGPSVSIEGPCADAEPVAKRTIEVPSANRAQKALLRGFMPL